MKPLQLLLLTIILLLTACSHPQVETDYDLKTDFQNASKTWSLWEERQKNECGTLNRDELERTRFYTALNQVMNEKGFLKASIPAWLVTLGYTMEDVLEHPPAMGIGGDSNGHGLGMGSMFGCGDTVHQYHQVKVIISFYRSDNKQLVWRASGAEFPPGHEASPLERNEAAKRLVQAVLKDFPPK
ncbi:MAG: DUF4136 domain-containing protein [Desulforhopalus sp.]|nr:DUF4136 domain-containing protein [Desulforhopalus sp.]